MLAHCSDLLSSVCRYATTKGYWRDDFIHFFSPSVDRKAPEISRGTLVDASVECGGLCVTVRVLCDRAGYYARVTAIYNLVREFIKFGRECGREVQVISLGAGSDTTFWRLEEEGLLPTQYVEVDLDDVVRRKCHIIK